MSVRSWAEALAIFKALEVVEKGGRVKDLAASLDKIIDERYPKKSEEIQKKFRQTLLYPLIYELGSEDPEQLKAEIKAFFKL